MSYQIEARYRVVLAEAEPQRYGRGEQRGTVCEKTAIVVAELMIEHAAVIAWISEDIPNTVIEARPDEMVGNKIEIVAEFDTDPDATAFKMRWV